MQHVIPTRRRRLPGALWVGLALMALAMMVMLSSYSREREVHAAAWRAGFDAAHAALDSTVADAYRAGLTEGAEQALTCDLVAQTRVLRSGCCGGRP